MVQWQRVSGGYPGWCGDKIMPDNVVKFLLHSEKES